MAYLFQGNAALRAEQLELAEASYRDALAIDPQYSRAYAGLGSTYYLLALRSGESGSFEPDADNLEQALQHYQNALDAEHQPVTADIPAKVAFGKGVVYLTMWLAGQDRMEAAVDHFNEVIEAYNGGENPRLQEAASEAHAHLGLIARGNEDIQVAIQEYTSAVELATNPARRGLYWAILGKLYQDQGELDLTERSYSNCIFEYTSAVKLTSQAERRAGYWGKIATCYEGLGKTPEAIFALGQALKYSPEGSDEYREYESHLLELQSTQAD